MKTSLGQTPGGRQRGMALVVVLLLLLVMTLLGLGSMRSTLMNERMSAAVYDRSLAFQLAESALREAEAAIANATTPVFGFDCETATGANVCSAVPTIAFTPGGGGCDPASNTRNCWINTDLEQDLRESTPQFYIEYLGSFSAEDELGLGTSANFAQYGGAGGTPVAFRYRVTARSHDPGADTGRSLVVLQTRVVRR